METALVAVAALWAVAALLFFVRLPAPKRAEERGIEQIIGEAGAALEADRPEEAASLAQEGMVRLRREAERSWLDPKVYEKLWSELSDLGHEAAGRSTSTEKGVDAAAAAGMLSGREAGNYQLVGYSMLVEDATPPRRILVPSQDELRRSGEGSDVAALEDDGLRLLRDGDLGRAEERFRRALELDPGAWPAMLGLSGVLGCRSFTPQTALARALRRPPAVPGIEQLIAGWDALTGYERGYAALCLAPLASSIPRILAAEGRVHIVALDARVTDVAALAIEPGRLADVPEDRRRNEAIGGIANGAHSATRIEELYIVSPRSGWTLAHEFAHQALNVADDAIWDACRAILKRARRKGFATADYELQNEHELFACAYERHAMRRALPEYGFDELHRADVELGLDELVRRAAEGG